MEYSFEIVGIAPVLAFFNHQQVIQQHHYLGAEYLGAYRCTLDAFIASIESMPMRHQWNLDRVVDTMIKFWLDNAEQVDHWKHRLKDAGPQNLLVARVADLDTLRVEFELLLGFDT